MSSERPFETAYTYLAAHRVSTIDADADATAAHGVWYARGRPCAWWTTSLIVRRERVVCCLN